MPSTKRPPKQTPKTIGNHKLKPATLMMGYGYDPSLSEGSLKAPIFLTSTFVFEKAADGKRFFEGITGKRPGGGTAEGLVYSRFNGPNQEILEDLLVGAVEARIDQALRGAAAGALAGYAFEEALSVRRLLENEGRGEEDRRLERTFRQG